MEKLSIVMCDSNSQELEGYAKICRSVCERAEVPVELKLYSDNESLMFDMNDEAFSALVSIFIIEPMGGFAAIPGTIRREGYDGLILYLSHSTDLKHWIQSYDVNAYNFIQKGNDKERLTRFQTGIQKALAAAKRLHRKYIVLSCAGEYKQIEIKDILYFEAAMDHMIHVEYKNGNQIASFHFPSTLSSMDERMNGHGFIRTHRSYVVSLSSISRLDYDDASVTLNNGKRIPVSKNSYAAVKTALERWQM